ncbi:NAD dependent epimerase/dehydratase [Calocera cornea HHB12733]|uniref:NAD dependent epimerase/dehydratase n=1 Tax=Calocera cornea HHB12733 TaxID=1353952 RepID=A0A165IRJ9_9BASI|nr:NAD dependent epimerase/dehydratase [Calocera cornea HHB12733]
MTRIIVTGASGVLGSAVFSAFTAPPSQYTVLGLSHTSSAPGLTPLDLLDKAAVERAWKDFAPDWVVHCAAERRPDVAERDPAGAERLNAGVPAHLAALASQLHHRLISISTDYVFPGTHPPYTPSSEPRPLNLYGRTKHLAEQALAPYPGIASAVRVPVLYGPVKTPSDSAINVLEEVVRDQSGRVYGMDDWQVRYPTNVLDVAAFLVRLVELQKPLPPIIHFTAPAAYSKYTLSLAFGRLLSLPTAHIRPEKPDESAPPPPGGAQRPRDCRLSMRETDALFGLVEGEGEPAEGRSWQGVEVVKWFEGWFREEEARKNALVQAQAA